MTDITINSTDRHSRKLHPLGLRIMHWINAVAMILMILSGWAIYNDSVILGWLRFPSWSTIGDGPEGALQWHFAAMWLLLANGILYLSINLFSGRLRRQFFPLTARQLFDDLFAALRGKLAHADLRHYNSVQKLAYLFVMVDSIVLVLSGLVLWKSVQFPLLRELIGGYETARRVHFFAMSGLVAFVVVHVVMVALVPRTLLAMLRGR